MGPPLAGRAAPAPGRTAARWPPLARPHVAHTRSGGAGGPTLGPRCCRGFEWSYPRAPAAPGLPAAPAERGDVKVLHSGLETLYPKRPVEHESWAECELKVLRNKVLQLVGLNSARPGTRRREGRTTSSSGACQAGGGSGGADTAGAREGGHCICF